MHIMNRSKRKMGYFTIKIDLAKAYDNMNWKFIKNVLTEVRIPENLKELILLVISTAKLRVLWKGDEGDFFATKKKDYDKAIPCLPICLSYAWTKFPTLFMMSWTTINGIA